MCMKVAELVPIAKKQLKYAPENINHAEILKVISQLTELIKSDLPSKRSGYSYGALLYVELYAQLTGLSTKEAAQNLQALWIGNERLFQSFQKSIFSNGKKRRAIPDQPTLTRFMNKIVQKGLSQNLSNIILWGQFLYTLKMKFTKDDLTLIADYNDEPCRRNPNDPYCFGTKEGQTVHRTLVFSIISGDLHIVVAAFKIRKREHKLPYFERVINRFKADNIDIKYFLVDRGFYRKDLLEYLKNCKISVITPGRQCKATKQKIINWLTGKGNRSGIMFLNLKYVRGVGWKCLTMNFILFGKGNHQLSQVKRDYQSGLISLETAMSRVFPLLFIFGNKNGITKVNGNEKYIRDLYRKRWDIEIAFRTKHLIGIGNWLTNRDSRLLRFGLKCFIYNQWQISQYVQSRSNSAANSITLKEFCGRLTVNRGFWAL
mgnify:CR=1 FL=1